MKPVKFYAKGHDNPNEFIISWNLGNTCNWSCPYCPSFLNDGSVPWNDSERIKPILLEIKERFQPRPIHIEFMGGEVTLKNDFLELMQFCKEQGFKMTITTNASRTIRYWQELAPLLNGAMLSFHPHFSNKDHYESIVQTLLDNNTHVSCHLAMTKEHFWELTEYKKHLNEKFPNAHVDYAILYDKERKYNHPHGYFYDYDQDQLDYLARDGSMNFVVEFDNGEVQELSLHDVRSLGYSNLRGYTCGSQMSILTVDYRGGAATSVCPQRNPVNIFRDGLENLFNPRICEQDECRNPADLRILKVRQ